MILIILLIYGEISEAKDMADLTDLPLWFCVLCHFTGLILAFALLFILD